MDSFEQIKEYLDSKFIELQREVPAESAPVKPIILKNKGNQNQLDHEEKLLFLVQGAEKALEKDEKDKAKEILNETKEEIRKRIKLIRLADKSEGGWQTVSEYLSDELASDSEDEKRIRRADNAACAKRKKKTNKEVTAKRARISHGSGNQFFRAFDQPQSYRPRRFTRSDLCYSCGKPGHWRRYCPDVARIGAKDEGNFSRS